MVFGLQLFNHPFDPGLVGTGLIAMSLKILVIIYIIYGISMNLSLTRSAVIVYGKGS
ncbi:hypothetical protein D3C74_326950 [compost metagenome]